MNLDGSKSLESTSNKPQKPDAEKFNKLSSAKECLVTASGQFEEKEDFERAQQYWKSQLSSEIRIKVPQHPNCEFAIVVPIYNESPERILKQVASIRDQKNISRSQFEVIYIVNNNLPTEDKKSTAIRQANQQIIETLNGVQDLNIFVIDKSSPGNEIENCNVGKARNRGVSEASLRFYENGKNGILIQTDADTYFKDKNYLSKLRRIIVENPDVIGVAGGLEFEFKPDTDNKEEIVKLQEKVAKLVLEKKWKSLIRFLKYPQYSNPADTKFSGANMISRSRESAIIGGLVDAELGEDLHFGCDLEAYSERRGKRVIGAKDELIVVTALRESDRTASSLKNTFNRINPEIPTMVSDPFVSETLQEFRNKIQNALEKIVSDPNSVRDFLIDEHGDLIVAESAFVELVEYAQQEGMVDNSLFYKKWITDHFGENYDLVQKLYDARHSQIPLTKENYNRLIKIVSQKPNGQKLVDYIEKATSNIKF